MTKITFRKTIKAYAKGGNHIVAVIPESETILEFAKSILPLVKTRIKEKKLPMIGKYAKLPGIIVFGESERLLTDKKYFKSFIDKAWNCSKTPKIFKF